MMLPTIKLVMIDVSRTRIEADMSIVSNKDWSKSITVEHNYYKVLKGLLKYYRESTAKIQDCFPFLNADEREFMLTGLTPEEQERIFKSDEDILMGAESA